MEESRQFPPGFRFNPTDEELICEYLYPKIMGWELPWKWMAEKEIYGANSEPATVFGDIDENSPYWITKGAAAVKKTIYVFTKVTKTSSNSKRNSRRAGSGTWTGQTGPKNITHPTTGEIIGCTRLLTFQRGKKGGAGDDRSSWNMHEYSLTGAGLKAIGDTNNDIVLCKIIKKENDRRRNPPSPPQQICFPAAGYKRGVREEGEEEESVDPKKLKSCLENIEKMLELDDKVEDSEITDNEINRMMLSIESTDVDQGWMQVYEFGREISNFEKEGTKCTMLELDDKVEDCEFTGDDINRMMQTIESTDVDQGWMQNYDFGGEINNFEREGTKCTILELEDKVEDYEFTDDDINRMMQSIESTDADQGWMQNYEFGGEINNFEREGAEYLKV